MKERNLEMMQVFFRAFRRLRLPLCFSKGFNPTPRVSFGPALSLGIESQAEFLLVTLQQPIADHTLFLDQLNEQLPAGLAATVLEGGKFKVPDVVISSYEATLPVEADAGRTAAFLACDQAQMTVVRKKKEKNLDVRPLVKELRIAGPETVELQLRSAVSTPGIKPQELLAWLYGLNEEQAFAMKIIKLWSREE